MKSTLEIPEYVAYNVLHVFYLGCNNLNPPY